MSHLFVFLHIGPALDFPSALCLSIRRHIPDAEIIQCSDLLSAAAEGVTRVFRIECDDPKNLMHVRLKAFSELGLTAPALYLDTDMVMMKAVTATEALLNVDAALCRRDFDRDAIFNHNFLGLGFEEYRGKTLDTAFPLWRARLQQLRLNSGRTACSHSISWTRDTIDGMATKKR
ncbi:MAG: hypothetical protein IPG93_08405 [Burkholderiales bacterium]|nr:hypothetical protein [Burkholderiales bacterium]